jgi:hypothetical protein
VADPAREDLVVVVFGQRFVDFLQLADSAEGSGGAVTPRRVVERIVVYQAYSGVHSAGGCSYENAAQYDDWDELVVHAKAALDADLQVMIEPTLMMPAEYEAEGKEFPAGVNPLLGESRRTDVEAL